MCEKFKISIMIISYNQENFISETIESVISQDYKNIEIIISDDASTDSTADIIREYKNIYPDKIFPIYNKKNLGITGNSNVALSACTGDLIAMLGGDDLFLPGKLKAQASLFSDPNVVLSYHSVEIFQHQTGEVLYKTNNTKRQDFNNVYDIVAKGGIPGASSVMVRKSACPNHGFDSSLPEVSDWIFCIEVALRGKIKKLDGLYARYRKHGNGASDRTYELLDESLQTLSIIEKRYPKDLKLKRACDIGAYRYLLGELFRQVQKGNQLKAKEVINKITSKANGIRYLIVKFVSILFSNKTIFKCASKISPKFKNTIKKWV